METTQGQSTSGANEAPKAEHRLETAETSKEQPPTTAAEIAAPQAKSETVEAMADDEVKPKTVPNEADAGPSEAAKPDVPTNSSSAAPSNEDIEEELLKYLKEDTFSMDVTERQLRTRLEARFGVPLKDRKAIIRDRIMEFIQAKQEMEEAGTSGAEAEEAGADDDEEISEEDEPVKKKRRGGGGLNASCRLSEPLQAFLGTETMSRPQVVKALWEYIKSNNLQDPTNKRKITVDEKLATLFTKPLDMFSMNRQLSKHVKTNDAPATAGNDEDSGGGSPRKEPKPRAKRKSDAGSEKPRKRAKGVKLDGTPKKNNPFTRPLKVSPELSEWLGGQTEISRPELTKRFWAYAKEKELLDPNKKSMLNCDEALKKLTGEDSFQCFGFAKYFKKHLLGYADQPAE